MSKGVYDRSNPEKHYGRPKGSKNKPKPTEPQQQQETQPVSEPEKVTAD